MAARKTSTATGRKKAAPKRRSRYSKAKIAEFKEADARLNALAEAALADPALGEQVTEAAWTLRGPFSPLRYSQRNVALLFSQVAARNAEGGEDGEEFTLQGGVATYKQWKQVGRAVKKPEFDRPLFISRPAPRDGDEVTATREDGQPVATLAEAVGDGDPSYFRSMKVYAYSQTAGIEDFEGEAFEPGDQQEAAEDGSPVEALVSSLIMQAQRAGYSVVSGPAVALDLDAAVVTVPDEADESTAPDLVRAVAKINLAQAEETRARRAASRAARAAERAGDVESITVL